MAYRINNNCIGCTLCARNCPVSAITGEKGEMHSINNIRCMDCGACGNVCAKSAIIDNLGNTCEKLPKSEWPKPVIDESICSGCEMCMLVCGKSALSLVKPKFKGDINIYACLSQEKNCVGCGICNEACPINAITMKKGVAI